MSTTIDLSAAKSSIDTDTKRSAPGTRKPTLFSGQTFVTLWRAWRTPDYKLKAEEAASTIFRFFRSEHVRDVKVIVAAILSLLLIYIVVVLIYSFKDFPD